MLCRIGVACDLEPAVKLALDQAGLFEQLDDLGPCDPIEKILADRAAVANRSAEPAPGIGTETTIVIDRAGARSRRCPVERVATFNLFRHARALLSHPSHPGRRDERQSLYWRSKRNLPRDFRRGRPAGVQVRSRCSKHGDSRATPGRPARSGQSTMPTSQ